MLVFLLHDFQEDSGGLVVGGLPGFQEISPVMEALVGMGRSRQTPEKKGREVFLHISLRFFVRE